MRIDRSAWRLLARRNKSAQREVSLEMTVVLGAEGGGGERWQRMRRRKESRLRAFQDAVEDARRLLNLQLSLGE
jgi:hypothetical protein